MWGWIFHNANPWFILKDFPPENLCPRLGWSFYDGLDVSQVTNVEVSLDEKLSASVVTVGNGDRNMRPFTWANYSHLSPVWNKNSRKKIVLNSGLGIIVICPDKLKHKQ